MNKIELNSEIKDLEIILSEREDTSYEYLTGYSKKLQSIVLVGHAHVDSTLETLLHTLIVQETGAIHGNKLSRTIPPTAVALVEAISFWKKLEILHRMDTNFPRKKIEELNSYRNEFAHKKGPQINEKYSYISESGKVEIIKLLQCIQSAYEDLDNYLVRRIPALAKRVSKKNST